jgi:hypothetical protein
MGSGLGLWHLFAIINPYKPSTSLICPDPFASSFPALSIIILPIAAVFIGNTSIMIIVIALTVFFWILLSIINASLNGILITALYNYTRTGKTSFGYSPDIFQAAFAPKKK